METRRDIFQAIADPTRRKILSSLIEDHQNVNSLSERFSMTRQAVSLHIKILKECDVIRIEKIGRQRVCYLKSDTVKEIQDWLEPFKKLWEDRFNQLDNYLETLKKNDEGENNE